ncbi:MAG: hypothetical protein AB1779_11345, partial [Candidatus Thermoplasmatota archaeon]
MTKAKVFFVVAMFLIAPIVSISSFSSENSRAVTYGSSWTQTTQSDFLAGTKKNIDVSTSPGDVKIEKRNWYNDAWKYRKEIAISGS